MRIRINGEKLGSILIPGCMVVLVILMICCAGCASIFPGTPKATPTPTTIPVEVTNTIPPTTVPVNLSASQTNATTTVPTTKVTATSPTTTISPNITTVQTLALGSGTTEVPVSPDPIIGTWKFASKGKAYTLIFSPGGQFTGMIDNTPSTPGTWKQVTISTYTVTLTSGESKNYRYDAETDELYDISNPVIFITRQ